MELVDPKPLGARVFPGIWTPWSLKENLKEGAWTSMGSLRRGKRVMHQKGPLEKP